MKYLKFTFYFSLFSFSLINAQTAPSIQWQKALGGSSYDVAKSIQQTSDGGYIFAGESDSTNGDVTGNHGNTDFWIVKLDASGIIQWQKSLGGSYGDTANSIQQTSDGGYIVAGESRSLNGDVTGNHGNADYWVVKLDPSGNIQWQKSLGGSNRDAANSVKQTLDGGYIIAGQSNSTDGDVTGNHGNYDYWIVKLDPSGTIQWQKSLGGSLYDAAKSIQQTSDGGYIVAGGAASADGDITYSQGNGDFWIVKLNPSGIIEWERSLTGNLPDHAESIQQIEGGYIVTGGSNSQNTENPTTFGISNYRVAKLDSNGIMQWQNHFGGSNNDYAYSTQQTPDGGYIVAGGAFSADGDVIGNHGNSDFWIIKLNSSGNLEWQKALGGSAFEDAYSIKMTNDGGFVIAGLTQSTDGDITGYHGNGDAWIVKLGAFLSTNENNIKNNISVYPNPAKDFVNIDNLPSETTISVTDASGRKILSKKYSEKNVSINTSGLINGNYIIQIEHDGTAILSKKIIISK
ncbi:T9SS type A sorting domain-containing protein [Chryseobacterium sp. 2TAF14]|uniref:T9SS type A sorting domain-containing protein n=1 Tax=Chryseobacterium sp. 2TAF14 TaxID=3233007 RepID=UPI003F90C0AE